MSEGRGRVVTKVSAKQIALHEKDEGKTSDSAALSDINSVRITFKKEGLAGKGTFGVVQIVRLLKVTSAESDEPVTQAMGQRLAMKTVVAKCTKSRELMILRKVRHPNIVQLRFFFFSHAKSGCGTLLNILFDLQPTTVYDMITQLQEREELFPREEVAEYGYQIGDGLHYLHSLGIAHRDIKPRNLLLRPECKTVQICDLGSACHLSQGSPLTTYICSRFYRAPELLLASYTYTTAIDLWSLGCVLAEMALLRPLMAGDDTSDQLAEIVDLMGVPSKEEMVAMGAEDVVLAAAMGVMRVAREEVQISPAIKITNLLGSEFTGLSELISQLLRFDPEQRITAADLLKDQFFICVQKRHHIQP